MGNLKKLQQVDISENKLDSLPNELGGMVSLTDLLLSQNLLKSLPDSIGMLALLVNWPNVCPWLFSTSVLKPLVAGL
jgi:Leucine-rich repeat (LRR) protein